MNTAFSKMVKHFSFTLLLSIFIFFQCFLIHKGFTTDDLPESKQSLLNPPISKVSLDPSSKDKRAAPYCEEERILFNKDQEHTNLREHLFQSLGKIWEDYKQGKYEAYKSIFHLKIAQNPLAEFLMGEIYEFGIGEEESKRIYIHFEDASKYYSKALIKKRSSSLLKKEAEDALVRLISKKTLKLPPNSAPSSKASPLPLSTPNHSRQDLRMKKDL